MTELIILAALLLYGSRQTIAGGIKAKTRFLPAYINNKPNPALIRANYKKPGVYLIKVNGKLKYIGYSSTNVYKTFTRHFQSWDDPRQIRITYPRASYVTARLIYTNTGIQAAKLERALILKYQPEDNPNKYNQYQLNLPEQIILDDYNAEDPGEAPF